jgi:mono/diheme cytochrome c family protein
VKKSTAGAGLILVAIVVAFALLSFLRENWGADQSPGAVERFVAGWLLAGSRRAVTEVPNPVPPTESNLNEGHVLYDKQCAFCHGEDGKGSPETGAQFYPPVPSLVDPSQTRSDAEAQAIISQGIRYTGMPSFAKALSEDERWKVVLWLRHLRSDGSATGN